DLNPPHEASQSIDPSPQHVILVHPAFTARQKSVPFPAGTLRPVPAPSGEPELRLPKGGPAFEHDDDYTDPVGATHPEYRGRWLVGFAPVGNTELVVRIQQRYDEAVAPLRAFLRRFLTWVGGAALMGAGLFAALWYVRSRRQPSPAEPGV